MSSPSPSICSVTAHCAQGQKEKPLKEDLDRTIRVLRIYTQRVERRGGCIDSDFAPTLRAALHHLESLNAELSDSRENNL